MQHGRKLARFHGKPDKTGDAVGRPSCPSSLLSDPNATFSVEMWRKPQRTRKIKKQETAGLSGLLLLPALVQVMPKWGFETASGVILPSETVVAQTGVTSVTAVAMRPSWNLVLIWW